jgi:predicted flap endonuclease-1-like 5' DNA nuclease
METISLQEKRREYYAKNKERIKEKSSKYYAENKQRVLERMKKAHKLNPDPARKRAKEFSKKNPDKLKKYQMTWKERNPEKRKLYSRNSRIRTYGIEPNEYYEMLEKQGHGCAICKAKPTYRAMNIDHNHKTGKVRGLLCDGCNLSLGHLERDDWVKKAKQYLAKYK